jgi:hypothetical protein
MNDARPKDFEDHLSRVIDPIMASPGRKRIMRADLLDHLQESYRMELGCQADEYAAIEAAITRLGTADELRLQLQASVPRFERVVFSWLDRKETLMSRWLFVVGVVAIVVGENFHFPLVEQVFLGGLALIGGLVLRHLLQKNNLASRLIGSRWPWLVGCVGVLFGTALVLPAMAKMKHEGAFALLQIEFLTVGAMIVLGGLYFIGHAVKALVARPV